MAPVVSGSTVDRRDPAFLRQAMQAAAYLLAPNQGERPSRSHARLILEYALGGPYAPSDADMERHGLMHWLGPDSWFAEKD